MPSPFPGMNPYLEQESVWQDFHDSIIPSIRDALSPQVSPNFLVKIEEHIYIHEPSAAQRIRVGTGDVAVVRGDQATRASSGGVGLLQAPQSVLIPNVEFDTETYLEIRDRDSYELITVIELLSPTNKKAGEDRDQFLTKRRNLLRSAAHYVEIDLLRGWQRMPCEQASSCDYCVLVSRVEDRPRAGFWPIALRDRLPRIPIPLRPPHANVHLELQDVLHGVYDRAYYKDYIYRGKPTPALSPADAAWAMELAQ